MILAIKKTPTGSEWKVSKVHDELKRWHGTVELSEDMMDATCGCGQFQKYLKCTDEAQVREFLELNNYKFKEKKYDKA